MKFSVGALVASLAGSAVAAVVGGQHSGLALKRSEQSKVDMVARDDDFSKYGLKFEAGEAAYNSPQFFDYGYGYFDDTVKFINNINFGDLKQIMGNQYGKPFEIDFYDYDDHNSYYGYIAGYFTTDGSVVWDQKSRLPRGASLPNLRSPSQAPQTVVVTANSEQSARIIQAGKITDQDLRELLGDDYGKPFRVVLTGDGGGRVGAVSGTFSGSGSGSGSGNNGGVQVIFDSGSQIPKPPSPNPDCHSTSSTNPNSHPPAPTDAPPNTNTGSISIGGGTQAEITDKLNHLDYNTILKATGGKYGEFYITFASADGRLQGYITGYIKSNGEYRYKWEYTIKG